MKRLFALLLLLAGLVAVAYGWKVYRAWMAPLVPAEMEGYALYIPTGSTAADVLAILQEAGLEPHPQWAPRLMERKRYEGSNVEPGRYSLKGGMSLNAIINHLRGGHGEEEVRITFHSARTLPELAGKVARNIEADSASLASLLLDPQVASRYGFKTATFKSMFLPDTYFTEWDTDAEEFIARMAAEYKRFWTDERKQRARALNLSESQVATLASIVQAEQQLHAEERPIIAGLYLNRLRKGMKLQSDPTVIYALGDFTINRVLNVHLQVDNPYNTYKYAGLPPGPINVPQKSSIDAVLYPNDNRYLYMCAKADFSGYHAFAGTLAEHNRNAAAYRNALNQRKIYK